MKISRFSEIQILQALRDVADGLPLDELLMSLPVSRSTFYAWRKKYGGLEEVQMNRLRELEIENRVLKRLVAELSLDKQLLKENLERK